MILLSLQCSGRVDVITTSNKVISTKHGQSNFITIEYEDRYDYLDAMDVNHLAPTPARMDTLT